MIVTVTLNVALDRTYRVARLEVGAVHEVLAVSTLAGGKGINVARVLHALGHRATAAGLVGASHADDVVRDLDAAGIPARLRRVAGATRQTVTVVDATGASTAFYEPGPPTAADDLERLLDDLGPPLAGADWMAVAGSLPPAAPAEAYGRLVALASSLGVLTLVDARGPALLAALPAGPAVVKLNRSELEETTAVGSGDLDAVVAAGRRLLDAGVGSVIVTLGAGGALALEGGSAWLATHPVRRGNPAGAGDAFSAAWIAARVAGAGGAEALAEGAAAGLASLLAPTAGRLDPAELVAARDLVRVEPVRARS